MQTRKEKPNWARLTVKMPYSFLYTDAATRVSHAHRCNLTLYFMQDMKRPSDPATIKSFIVENLPFMWLLSTTPEEGLAFDDSATWNALMSKDSPFVMYPYQVAHVGPFNPETIATALGEAICDAIPSLLGYVPPSDATLCMSLQNDTTLEYVPTVVNIAFS